MARIKSFFKSNILLLAYLVLFFFLLMGVYYSSGYDYLNELFLFLASLLIFYIVLKALTKGIFSSNFGTYSESIKLILRNKVSVVSTMFLLLMIISIVTHFLYLNYFPLADALNSNNSYIIADIRRNITVDSGSFYNYLSSFTIKTIIPFSLLYFYIKKKYYHLGIILLLGSFYSIALLQKSFIISIMSPIIIYTFLNRKYLFASFISIIVVLTIILLVIVTNPSLRGGIDYAKSNNTEAPVSGDSIACVKLNNSVAPKEVNRTDSIYNGISNRVFFVPGKMVSNWFSLIPKKYPFLHGKGYNFINRLTGETTVDYSTELYKEIYPYEYSRGLKGTVNTASFMYDYSNFGNYGLILSGFLLAVWFLIVDFIFANNFKLKVSINLFYILMLSSSALTTLLFSGGWVLTLILTYFLIEKDEI